MQMTKDEEIPGMSELEMTIEVLDEDLLCLEDTFEQIEKEIRDKTELIGIEKKLEYFSNTLIIYTFIYKERIIFETFDRSEEKSDYTYLADQRMHKSHLLNLINRGESIGIKKKYL